MPNRYEIMTKNCQHNKTNIVYTIESQDLNIIKKRSRVCKDCGKRFNTVEILENRYEIIDGFIKLVEDGR